MRPLTAEVLTHNNWAQHGQYFEPPTFTLVVYLFRQLDIIDMNQDPKNRGTINTCEFAEQISGIESRDRSYFAHEHECEGSYEHRM